MDGLGAFEQSKRRIEKLKLEDIELPIISFDDLIANKRAVNREIDRSDIEELYKRRNAGKK